MPSSQTLPRALPFPVVPPPRLLGSTEQTAQSSENLSQLVDFLVADTPVDLLSPRVKSKLWPPVHMRPAVLSDSGAALSPPRTHEGHVPTLVRPPLARKTFLDA